MRIAYNIIIIIAVVTLAAGAVGWQRDNPSANSSEVSMDMSYEGVDTGSTEGINSLWRSHMMTLRNEGGPEGLPVDCCPSTLEIVEPLGGVNQSGAFVELYREGTNKQRFFDLSCRKGVENKPCRFVDRRFYNQSRCIQKYSYSYAIVKASSRPKDSPAFPGGGDWMMDYIRVRSGCSCEVTPRPKKKRGNNKRNRKHDKEI